MRPTIHIYHALDTRAGRMRRARQLAYQLSREVVIFDGKDAHLADLDKVKAGKEDLPVLQLGGR